MIANHMKPWRGTDSGQELFDDTQFKFKNLFSHKNTSETKFIVFS